MRLSTVLNVKRIKLRNRIFTLGFIITGMLSLAFGVVTFYGQNAGNFVMSVDTAARLRGISLTENPTDPIDPQDMTNRVLLPRLMSDPVNEARDVTYAWLKLDEIQNTEGNFTDIDHDYVAYTFYLINDGSETVDVNYYIRLTEIYNNLDTAVRILVIQDGIERMYMREDVILEGQEAPYYPAIMPDPEYFLTENMVMRSVITNFKPGDDIKFSVVVWLEGYDPDCTDDVLGGMIKMVMNFAINGME